jgi:hypothetical protein
LQLRDVLNAIGGIGARDWDGIEKAILLCEPVAVATDRVQADSTNAVMLIKVYHLSSKRSAFCFSLPTGAESPSKQLT